MPADSRLLPGTGVRARGWVPPDRRGAAGPETSSAYGSGARLEGEERAQGRTVVRRRDRVEHGGPAVVALDGPVRGLVRGELHVRRRLDREFLAVADVVEAE